MFDDTIQIKRILAVDDDPNALAIVRHTLEMAGFDVMTASSGEDALLFIRRFGLPHLAIVDYQMPPGMNGFEFCRAVRAFSDLPIIMLTAVDEAEKIVASLEAFADDYVVKPFNPNELTARVQRILRRMDSFDYTEDGLAQVDQRMQVDFPNRRVFIDGEPVSLTPTESKLLYILMRNAGRIVTTQRLLSRLWPTESVQEDRLHVHVHRLRGKVEPHTARPRYILSEHGQGYSFLPKVESLT